MGKGLCRMDREKNTTLPFRRHGDFIRNRSIGNVFLREFLVDLHILEYDAQLVLFIRHDCIGKICAVRSDLNAYGFPSVNLECMALNAYKTIRLSLRLACAGQKKCTKTDKKRCHGEQRPRPAKFIPRCQGQ